MCVCVCDRVLPPSHMQPEYKCMSEDLHYDMQPPSRYVADCVFVCVCVCNPPHAMHTCS